MFAILLAVVGLVGCAPTMESVQADLVKVQNDLKTIAANSAPAIQTATTIATIGEAATGDPGLIPLTNLVSGAVQAANVAIANQATLTFPTPTPQLVVVPSVVKTTVIPIQK